MYGPDLPGGSASSSSKSLARPERGSLPRPEPLVLTLPSPSLTLAYLTSPRERPWGAFPPRLAEARPKEIIDQNRHFDPVRKGHVRSHVNCHVRPCEMWFWGLGPPGGLGRCILGGSGDHRFRKGPQLTLNSIVSDLVGSTEIDSPAQQKLIPPYRN